MSRGVSAWYQETRELTSDDWEPTFRSELQYFLEHDLEARDVLEEAVEILIDLLNPETVEGETDAA